MRKLLLCATALMVAMPLAGCAGLANLSDLTAPPSPTTITDIASAERAADVGTVLVKQYIDQGTHSSTQLRAINAISDTLNQAIVDAHGAVRNHQPLSLVAIRAAYSALIAYQSAK
jgi:hypothetical protein